MSIRLSREEAWAALTAAHTGILTTLRTDGTPVALPVWFVALDERIYVGTPSRTRKVARIRRNARVSFLIESGERWTELFGVHITGEARVVTELELRSRVDQALIAKYERYRVRRDALPESTRRYYEVEMTVLEVIPDERILSWDNSRLPLAD